jgi:hypothetical protein
LQPRRPAWKDNILKIFWLFAVVRATD